MNHYLHGTAVLSGFEPRPESCHSVSVIGVAEPAPETTARRAYVPPDTSPYETYSYPIIGIVLGTLAATIGLSLACKEHRVIGGILGFFIVGAPVVGGGFGILKHHRLSPPILDIADQAKGGKGLRAK